MNTRCLCVDSRDRLWIGTNDFGLFLMENNSLRRVNQPEAASISIRCIAEDPEGVVYVGTAAGVFTVDADMNAAVIADEQIASMTIVELRAGADGLIYGTKQEGDLFMLKDGRLLAYLEHEECGMESIIAILPDFESPGKLYVATEDSGTGSARIDHGTPEDHFASAETVDISPLSYVERMEDIDGEIWICAGNGIGKLSGDTQRLMKNVPMDKSVGHVMTDHEGNLWFTSSRQCVM